MGWIYYMLQLPGILYSVWGWWVGVSWKLFYFLKKTDLETNLIMGLKLAYVYLISTKTISCKPLTNRLLSIVRWWCHWHFGHDISHEEACSWMQCPNKIFPDIVRDIQQIIGTSVIAFGIWNQGFMVENSFLFDRLKSR